MPKLIKDRAIADDEYTFVEVAEDGSLTLPAAPVLVKLATWTNHRDALLAHPYKKGVQLASEELVDTIENDIAHFELIAIEFPIFTVGRGYSTAHALRGRLGYKGELRAVGDIFKDTMFYQQRCGFNAFVLKEGKSIDDALKGLLTFTRPYQGSAENPRPLFMSKLEQTPLAA